MSIGQKNARQGSSVFGVDRNKVQREIRLTYFDCPLLEAVDARKLNLMCGVALSYYDEQGQRLVWERLRTGEKADRCCYAASKTAQSAACARAGHSGRCMGDAAVPHRAKKLVFEGGVSRPISCGLRTSRNWRIYFWNFCRTGLRRLLIDENL